MAYLFTAADNVTVLDTVPLDTNHFLWSSAPIAQGSQFKACSITFVYHEILPDVEVSNPAGISLVAVVEQKQEDESWLEIGRQNTPIVKLEQGRTRTIVINPSLGLAEEGVDQYIQGLNGTTVNVKSKFDESAEGDLRICLLVHDRTVGSPQPHPFTSVTFSCHGRRYDPS